MAISDIFSSSFLISLAITLFVASMLYIYISNKFAEQNHKINSMFSLISTMAEEQQYFRAKLIGRNSQFNDLDKAQFAPHLLNNENNENINNDLISVSDNQDQESDYIDDSESETNSESDSESEYDMEEYEQTNNIDILNLGLINHDNLGLNETQNEINSNNNRDELIDIDSDSTSTINLSNIKTIHLEEPIIQINNTNELDLTSEININDNEHEHTELVQDNDTDTINTSNTLDNHYRQEYKKMSLNKLREVIVEKGLLQDASKLKKNEILKLLGDE
jgi:hypothetical protein